MIRQFCMQVLTLLVALFAQAIAPSTYNEQNLPPSKDPWYTAPDRYEDTTPGAILRIRTAPGNLTAVYGATQAYNLLFRTTNSHYNESWAVTTTLVPTTAKDGATALLSYQVPYDSADLDQSPSYTVYAQSDVVAALMRGWYVNIPDYEGPFASFAAGVTAGHAVLDSIRAASTVLPGSGNETIVAMWGYSGGALATEFAAELQVQYASELRIAGAALGGPPSNTTNVVMNRVSETQFASLVPSALLDLSSQYPEARDYLISQLKPSGFHNRTGFFASLNMTNYEDVTVFNGSDVWDYFVHGKASIAESPIWRHIWNKEAVMGYHGIPQMPLYIYKAIHDEITPVGDTDRMVDFYCTAGANILYERNTVGGHLSEELNGDAYGFQFLDTIFNQTYQHSGCTTRNVTWDSVSSSPV